MATMSTIQQPEETNANLSTSQDVFCQNSPSTQLSTQQSQMHQTVQSLVAQAPLLKFSTQLQLIFPNCRRPRYWARLRRWKIDNGKYGRSSHQPRESPPPSSSCRPKFAVAAWASQLVISVHRNSEPVRLQLDGSCADILFENSSYRIEQPSVSDPLWLVPSIRCFVDMAPPAGGVLNKLNRNWA